MDDPTKEDIDLVRSNSFSIYAKHRHMFVQAGLSGDDALSAGWEGWVNACTTYQPNGAPLSYWKHANVRWSVMSLLRSSLSAVGQTILNNHDPADRDFNVDIEEAYMVTDEHERVRQYLIDHQDDVGVSLLLLRYYGRDDGKPMTYRELSECTGKADGTLAYHMKTATDRLVNWLEYQY